MDRRRLCKGLGMIAAWGAVPSRARSAAGAHPGIERIGLQLYTVRELMQEDLEGTLEAVAAAGYREVELAGTFGRGPAEIRRMTESLGLDPVAAHVSLEALRRDAAAVADEALEGGQRFVVLASLPRGERSGLEAYRRLAEEMNGFGRACREAGLRFAYHNHDYELEVVAGVRPYDLLLDGTEPELVDFEIDVYWATRGGLDPLTAFARWPGRFRLCHLKDMTADGDMADVGAGVIDFAAILGRAEQAGMRHFFVEHDRPGDPLASIRASHRYLSSLDV